MSPSYMRLCSRTAVSAGVLVLACAAAACGGADKDAPARATAGTSASPTATVGTSAPAAQPSLDATTSAAAPSAEPSTTPEDAPERSAAPTLRSEPEMDISREGKFWGGDDFDPATAARLPHERLDNGTQVDILGDEVTVCSSGGFYGIHYVGASGLDCAAADEVARTALAGEDPATNVHFPTARTVASGGDSYTCTEQGNIVLTCRAGEKTVLMW